MSFEVIPLEQVGVEVKGFDISRPLSTADQAALKDIWLEHGIVLFRRQRVDPHSQITFSRIFGELELHPLKVTRDAEFPELFMLESGGENDKYHTAFYDGEALVNRLDWHMDLHYTAKPNHGAVLCSRSVAEEGGLTGFGDLAKAYEHLDEQTKSRLKDLEVAYSFCMQRRNMRYVDTQNYEPGPYSPTKPADVKMQSFPDAIYPIVVKHPVTGKKVLEIVEQFLDRVVNPYKAGMSNDEGIELLKMLVAHIKKPEFHYFHRWEEGDMILWDNWRAMHCTTGTKPGVHRLMHRTTIKGEKMLGRQEQ